MTPKAQSLPSDLRPHFEDLMAEKFPMSQMEAMAYIQSRYGDICNVYQQGDGLQIRATKELKVPEGGFPPINYTRYEEKPWELGRTYYIDEYVNLNEYKKSDIDDLLSKYRK